MSLLSVLRTISLQASLFTNSVPMSLRSFFLVHLVRRLAVSACSWYNSEERCLPYLFLVRFGVKSCWFLSVSGTNSCQRNGTYSRDRGSGGIRSKNVPRDTRSAFVFNAKLCSLSHGDVICHRPWTFPLVSHDLKI